MTGPRTALVVVIVTYNSANDIANCLSALAEATREPYTLVVVDNDSQDDTIDRLRELRIDVYRSETNLGFAGGCNLAMQLAAPSDFLLLLNPDARPLPGSVDALRQAANRHPSGAVFGARILTPAGGLDPSCAMGAMTVWSALCFGLGLSSLFPQNRFLDPESLAAWQRDDERQVPVIPGTMALVRRCAWQQVGGFDERFFMYSEDTDLCLRLRKANWSCWLVPTSSAWHDTGASSSPGARIVMLLRGRVTYATLHMSPFLGRVVTLLLLLGVGLRARGPDVARAVTKRRTERPRTSVNAWTEALTRRSEWLHGWGAGSDPA